MDEGSRVPSLVPSVSLGWLQCQGGGVPSPQQALWWLQVDRKDKVTLEDGSTPLPCSTAACLVLPSHPVGSPLWAQS